MTIKFFNKGEHQFYLFGNKGAVWGKTTHIAGGNVRGTTLCGTPMLSSNHAAFEGVQEAGCPECIEILEKEYK